MDIAFKMIEIFNGNGVVFEREDRKESNKAVIIIDDEWDGAKLSFDQALNHPRPDKKAMAAIKSALQEIDSVKKIAFLTLPEKKGDIDNWYAFFGNWVKELNCTRFFILVDIFYGPPELENNVGEDLLEYLVEKYNDYKIAFFSKAGFAAKGVHKERKIFEKSQVTGYFHKTKQLSTQILEWIEEYIDPVKKLSKELIRGCQVGDNKDGHPTRIEQIPNDMVCYETLVETEKPLENFKALYYPKDFRGIDADLFSSILKNVGIKNNWKTKPTERFFLPTKPGMIFFICLVDFLQHMNKSEIVLDTLQEEKGKHEIIISLELNDPERFKEGIFTGGGKGIEKYRNLLGCKKNIIQESLSQEEKATIQTDNWYPAPMENGKCGNSSIYKCLLNGRIDGNQLIISWRATKPS